MIPVFRKSFMIIAIIVVILSIVMLLMPKSIANNQTVQVEFQEKVISPGETTMLNVIVKNNLGEDLEGIEIEVKAIDESSLIIGNSIQIEEIIGKDETRKFTFPISVYDNVREGTYSVEVSTNIKDNTNLRISIEVEE